MLGWIVEHILGMAPLMQGHRDVQARVTSPLSNWLRTVALAIKEAGKFDQWLRSHQLLDLVLERGIATQGIDLDLDTDNHDAYMKGTRAIGRNVSQVMKDKKSIVIDGMTIEREDDRQRWSREARTAVFMQSPNRPQSVPQSKHESPQSPQSVRKSHL